MIAAIVAPVGIRNIAMMRACLVSGLAADLDGAAADRLRAAGLAVFRAVERVAGFVLSLSDVVRLSNPPRAHERLQLAASRILRRPIAIMPVKCLTVDEWIERFRQLQQPR